MQQLLQQQQQYRDRYANYQQWSQPLQRPDTGWHDRRHLAVPVKATESDQDTHQQAERYQYHGELKHAVAQVRHERWYRDSPLRDPLEQMYDFSAEHDDKQHSGDVSVYYRHLITMNNVYMSYANYSLLARVYPESLGKRCKYHKNRKNDAKIALSHYHSGT